MNSQNVNTSYSSVGWHRPPQNSGTVMKLYTSTFHVVSRLCPLCSREGERFKFLRCCYMAKGTDCLKKFVEKMMYHAIGLRNHVKLKVFCLMMKEEYEYFRIGLDNGLWLTHMWLRQFFRSTSLDFRWICRTTIEVCSLWTFATLSRCIKNCRPTNQMILVYVHLCVNKYLADMMTAPFSTFTNPKESEGQPLQYLSRRGSWLCIVSALKYILQFCLSIKKSDWYLARSYMELFLAPSLPTPSTTLLHLPIHINTSSQIN